MESWQKKSCRADLSSVSDPSRRLLPKGVLKQELSGIQVTTLFGINNSGNIEGMNVIFFYKMLKMLCRSQKCDKMFRKFFPFSR